MKKTPQIIPAILEKKFREIKKKVKRVQKETHFIQIDICDGILTPQKTFASSGFLKSFLKLKTLFKNNFLELDIIIDFKKKNVSQTENFLNSIKKSGVKRVVFHNLGINNWENIFSFFSKQLKNKNIEIGLGCWLSETNLSIEKILKEFNFNYIQIMGIEEVGFGGQKISSKVFKKVKYFSEKFPKIPIQVDGGVKLENLKNLSKNGVSRFVSGSGIFNTKNIGYRMKEFQKEIKNKK